MKLVYDFRKNNLATYSMTVSGVTVVGRGDWKLVGDTIVFNCGTIDPISHETQTDVHVLRFDGDDLFPDGIVVRFVREK